MEHEERMRKYAAYAQRETQAADRATSKESAKLHRALSEMYQHEAAKMASVRKALGLAFVV